MGDIGGWWLWLDMIGFMYLLFLRVTPPELSTFIQYWQFGNISTTVSVLPDQHLVLDWSSIETVDPIGIFGWAFAL